jgi:hypothetical protein
MPSATGRRNEPPAATAKARKVQHVPLAESVVGFVASLIAGKQPDDRLIGSSRPRSWVVAGDAKAAKIARRHETVGLHSFRKGFVTALAAAGAPMSVTQELARHTDPRLTQAVYVEANLLPLRQAINALAATGYEKSENVELDSGRAADRMATSQQPMPTPKNIPEPRAAARESLATAVVTNSLAGGLAVAGGSGFSCGGLSTEQAQDWARQDSNLLRSVVDVLSASADLIRRLTSQVGGCDGCAHKGHVGCGDRREKP